MKERLYLKVTPDKYRFIVDMGTAQELADKYGISVNCIYSTASKYKNDIYPNGRYEVVELD